MTKYIAFLRGINVGGNKKVPMSDLKKTFESLGFKNVKTLLNSGNVVFEGSETNAETLETELKSQFGFDIPVILRTAEEVQKMVDSNPFQGIQVTPDTRFYVTFMSAKTESKLEIPYVSPDKNFKILQITEGEVVSVLILSPTFKTTEAMGVLEKEFGSPRGEAGKNVTTRNWNTVQKILSL